MPESTLNTVIAAAASIVGVLIGYIAAELAQKRREWEHDAQLARAVRAMLRIEIDRNIAAALELHARIQPEVVPDDEELTAARRAAKFRASPAPAWSTEVWRSQLPHVPMALGLDEQTITAVFGFYVRLNQVTSMHYTIEALIAESRSPAGDGPSIGRTYGPDRVRIGRDIEDVLRGIIDSRALLADL